MPGPIARPVMRGMHLTSVKRALAEVVVVAAVTGFAYKHFVMDARRKVYDEFHRTYDPVAAAERINATGYMRTAPQNINK